MFAVLVICFGALILLVGLMRVANSAVASGVIVLLVGLAMVIGGINWLTT